MKIVIVTGIFPPDIGGPASYVPRLARALGERGHAVDVVTLADGQAIERAECFPFPVHRIPRAMNRPLRMMRTVGLIARLARQADVILSNGLYMESAVAAHLAGTPSVAKVVGDTIWERARHAGRTETLDKFQLAPLPPRWRALRKLQNAWIGAFDCVFTPSEYLKHIAIGWGVPESRVAVIYNAVPKVPPMRDRADAEPFDIVSVGRMVPWKGFGDLLALAARRGWSLRLVGDGPLRHALELQAKESGQLVRFDGHLPQAELPDVIRSARVFVLNSSYEGLPHIVLEAMGSGVPVIATAAGGTPETIDDGRTGFLVPVGNTDALDEALTRLLADRSLRNTLAANASAMLANRFSFDKMIGDTEDLLLRVRKRSGR